MMRRPNQHAAKGAARARRITDEAIREQKRRTRPAKAYTQTKFNPGAFDQYGPSVDLDAHNAEVSVTQLEQRMPLMGEARPLPQPRQTAPPRDDAYIPPQPTKAPDSRGTIFDQDRARRY